MKHYIDKDVLVAELKKKISDYWSDSENTMGIYPYALEEVIKYIDTLEVKEVDLEKKLDSMKSPEESLGIDSDTYNKIVDECVYGEQKPTEWSEEDEKQARQIERIVHNGCTQKLQKQIADWFKALKNRYTWKPSDEQMKALAYAVFDTQSHSYHDRLSSLEQQLKKLKGE